MHTSTMKIQNVSSTDKDVPELTKEDPYQPVPGSAEEMAYKMSDQKNDLSVDFTASLAKHKHNGQDSYKLSIYDLLGSLRTVTATPGWIPVRFAEQFAFYENGGTRRIYIYGVDQNGVGAWRYVALT